MPATTHTWAFSPRFRSRAFTWHGSQRACQRLKEAVSEIKKVARVDPVTAADGAVYLATRIWPAFQMIDTSSGALGGAVNWALETLVPIVAQAPVDAKTRDAWLERLWQAIQDDGVSYLSTVEDHWGQLCASAEVASRWADRILPKLRAAWSDPQNHDYIRSTALCLSSLIAAGRHQELFDTLALKARPFWPERRFGVDALLAQGRIEDALAYAEASRTINDDLSIDMTCERILLDAGRADEAYERYAIKASQAHTDLAAFRQLMKRYPQRDPRTILLDLARAGGDVGRWFAAAKNAGFLDLALEFAEAGRTDPRTLGRASRDLLDVDPQFSLRAGMLAIERILGGFGGNLTGLDARDICEHYLAAVEKLGLQAAMSAEYDRLAAKFPPRGTRNNSAVFSRLRSAVLSGT